MARQKDHPWWWGGRNKRGWETEAWSVMDRHKDHPWLKGGRNQPRMRDGRMISDGQTKGSSLMVGREGTNRRWEKEGWSLMDRQKDHPATTERRKDQPKMKDKKIIQLKSEKDHPKRSFRLERWMNPPRLRGGRITWIEKRKDQPSWRAWGSVATVRQNDQPRMWDEKVSQHFYTGKRLSCD